MKQSLVINLRGNSGSGKTHVTREFMSLCQPLLGDFQEDNGFRFGRQKWVVLGRYGNTCGGCDTIKTQQEVIDRVEAFTDLGYNVWLEGLIMSTIYGSVGEYSEQFGNHWVFAYLLTPLDVCLERIYKRRQKAGNTKPFNENNTRNRVHSIESSRLKCVDRGRRVLDLDWHRPLPQILQIIRKEG